MYHRYMPNANGQYRRQTVQEAKPAPCPSERNAAPKRDAPAERGEPRKEPAREGAPEITPPPVRKNCPSKEQPSAQRDCPAKEQPPACRQVQGGMLSALFPGMDSGDLLLLALLLLLISEGTEDAAPTILTLALALIL